MGLVTTAEQFAVFEARNWCPAFSCTAIQYNSQSAQVLLRGSWRQENLFLASKMLPPYLRGKPTVIPCWDYTSTWPHHLSAAFCPGLLLIKNNFLCMSKGFCCPFFSSSLPLIMHRRTLQLWADLPTLIPNASKHSSVHTSCFNYDHFVWKKWI